MRRLGAVLVLVALLGGCGRYGPPLRAWEVDDGGVSAVRDHDDAACEDPEHDHQETP